MNLKILSFIIFGIVIFFGLILFVYLGNIEDKSQNTIVIFVDKIPADVDSDVISNGISTGLDSWSARNSEIIFEQFADNFQLKIVFTKTKDDTHIQISDNGIMEIPLGSYDCNGTWQQYSELTISDFVAHAIGHYLGLSHHTDESHLMYDKSYDKITEQFNDLGLNVPPISQKHITWIGWFELESQLVQFTETDDSLNHNRIVRQMNCMSNFKLTLEHNCIAN